MNAFQRGDVTRRFVLTLYIDTPSDSFSETLLQSSEEDSRDVLCDCRNQLNMRVRHACIPSQHIVPPPVSFNLALSCISRTSRPLDMPYTTARSGAYGMSG